VRVRVGHFSLLRLKNPVQRSVINGRKSTKMHREIDVTVIFELLISIKAKSLSKYVAVYV
jgi:hypothetical protein